MSDPFAADPIVVEVVRSGLVESVHHARVAVTAADGSLLASVGAVEAPMFPRSASKPLQAVGMRRAGLQVGGRLLALICASHSGERFHRDGVREILAGAGLDEQALQTPPDWPIDDEAREEWVREGGHRERICMNCSGKHAGMLATAVANGWDVATYRDPEHPVQRAILETIDEFAGEHATDIAVDGCGAPLFAISLTGLARSYGRLAAATGGEELVVADAIRANPAWISGTRRDERALHEAFPGLVTKAGAEAVQAVGLPDGTGIAVKVSDGYPRARAVLTAGVLLALGLDHPTLREQSRGPVLGHGVPVGAVQIRPGSLQVLQDARTR